MLWQEPKDVVVMRVQDVEVAGAGEQTSAQVMLHTVTAQVMLHTVIAQVMLHTVTAQVMLHTVT